MSDALKHSGNGRPKINILLVDDRLDGLIAMEAVLASENYNLVTTHRGREALTHIKNYEFAAILLDVQMPEMDGFEVARLIRQYPPCKHTPIIFITAISQDSKHVYKGYESGAVDYIFKPLDEFILKSKIKVYVDLFNKNKQIQEQAEVLKEMTLREQEHLRETLEIENLKRYVNLANAIPHIVFKVSPQGRIEFLNQTWYDSYSSNQSRIEKLDWRDMTHPEDRRKIYRAWLKRTPGETFRFDSRIKYKDGSYRWHLISMVPENVSHGIVGWLGTCTDIHDQKIKEHQFQALTENLNRSNVELERFAYIASHDLQEPLRKIITFTELVQGELGNAGQQVQEYCSRIHRAGYRMKSVIEDLLLYSRISRNTDHEKTPINLNTVTKEVLADLEIRIFQSRARITVDPLPDVNGNATQIRLLFQNLLVNAIKFSKKDDLPQITVRHLPFDNGIREIHIADNGIGIEEQYTDKIFQPFQKLHRKDEYEGSGIGLSIVKKIIEHHGWKIRVKSQAGSGATFILTIPAYEEPAACKAE